ncbi:FKBP-type peptidyl-prolyl cis-trans isomerase [bacterium]|nr:MAG: FKBP-type peptidyl-prolyl cis-trans isomerase [bacterium]
MKGVIVALLALGILGCQNTGSKSTKLETKTDSVSYMIGYNVGRNLSKDSIKVNDDAFVLGLNDASADSAKRLLSDSVLQITMDQFQSDMQERQMANMKILAEKNKDAGDAFLAENKTREGVVTLPSGLQFKVITEGRGPSPKANQTVSANYRGTFLDGKEFDNSGAHGGPAEFRVDQVIPAWSEALQKMKVGSRWMVWAPADLAYGEHGNRSIPPNSTLVFEIELVAVK